MTTSETQLVQEIYKVSPCPATRCDHVHLQGVTMSQQHVIHVTSSFSLSNVGAWLRIHRIPTDTKHRNWKQHTQDNIPVPIKQKVLYVELSN